MPQAFFTRFAPSPTGLLHLGHAYSALAAWDAAERAGGTCLLRIEDLDHARVRPNYEAAIYEDLAWLGLSWSAPVMRQSERQVAYEAALQKLGALGLIYPCSCSRADIRAALAAPQETEDSSLERGAESTRDLPFGPVYPGTCRGRSLADKGPRDALRLDLQRAFAFLGGQSLIWHETGPKKAGTHRIDEGAMIAEAGDVVLARGDIGAAAYHLAVVVDDAAQGVTDIIRGEDLLAATPIHRLLQALLDLPVPVWHHHRLIRDEEGKRLAKRDDARSIRTYREAGMRPEEIRDLIRDQIK